MNMHAFLSTSKKLILAGTLMCAFGGIARAADPVLIDYGPAPDFSGIGKWLNSEPLSMPALRGKVVLVDFWTYSCINCLRTLPYVAQWHQRYKDKGLVVVGVHTPEYAFERSTRNVQTAIKRFNIPYAVAQDNQYATWKAYENQYWPAVYLIDRKGRIVLKHFGEGHYDEMEQAIKMLLAKQQ
jgi:thiol-disulfide isomerase/thioredoxin